MRIKFAIVITASLLNASAFAATPRFTGFYAGVNAGWANTDITDTAKLSIHSILEEPGTTNENNRIYTASSRENENGLTAGLNIGYTRLIHEQYLIGVEGRANFENLKITFDDARYTLNQAGSTTSAVIFNNQVNLNNDFEFLVKFGVSPLSMPNILLYGLIGPAWGNFHVSEKFAVVSPVQTLGKNASHSSYVNGILAGIGMEYQMNDHMHLALEFTHTNYGRLGIKDLNQSLTTSIQSDTNLLTTVNLNSSVNAKASNFTLKINYYL